MTPAPESHVEFGPPAPRRGLSWLASVAVACAISVVPAYNYLIWFPGGIRLTNTPPPWGFVVVILFVPSFVTLILGCFCLLAHRRTLGSTEFIRFRRSAIVLLLWIGAVIFQSVRDVRFSHRLLDEIQPWAQSVLGRPRGQILSADGRTLKPDLVPSFVGPVHGNSYGHPDVALVHGDQRKYGATEDYIEVLYGGGLIMAHGYIAGRKSLQLPDGGNSVRKVSDGVYTFE